MVQVIGAKKMYHCRKVIVGGFSYVSRTYGRNYWVETSYPVDQGHDLECCVAEAVSQGCDCIIYGYSTYLYLKNGPIPVVTTKVSRETIFNVLKKLFI
ncbi:hypothetical protein [Enterocloster sp.]|uniref:hypothetical protein n=1 Tax=Enterocloster sp. TaxID=2719315 RepID=UPI0039A17069